MAWYDPILQGLGNAGGAIVENAGPLALGTAGLLMAKEGYDKLGSTGERAYESYTAPGGLADRISGMDQFQPYTVTSTTGSNFGMTQAPGTGGAGSVNPQQAIDNRYRNAENASLFSDDPELQAAFAAGASSQASANELAAFNLGVPDLNSDGRLSNEEFTSWDGYAAYSAQNGEGILLNDGTNPAGFSGSRFTGQYNPDGTPVYTQTGAGVPQDQENVGGVGGTGDYPSFVPAGQQGAMNYALTLSPEEKLMQDAQLGRAESMFGLAAVDPAAREQAVFDRMMAAIRPERTRESNRLQGQLQAQGRLGVRTDMYGGTPEQLAMAKAQEEAYSQNMLAAMNFAGQEQSRQAALGSGMLANAYVPQAQLLNAVQTGMTASEQRRAQLAQQTQSYGETYSTGLQALLSSAMGQSVQATSVGSGLATKALGGLFGT
jgi:hypothetical protein